jgi:putative transposase
MAFNKWARTSSADIDLTRPGKLMDNAFIEPFNRRARQECLNGSRFVSPEDDREEVEDCRQEPTI